MGKTFKKFLVMLVALSMVFTMTAMPVYADDTAIDQETESAVLTETVENDAAVENTEEPAVTETATEETQPAVTEEPQVVITEDPTAETEIETTVPEETVIPQENITPAENTETSENAEEVAIETVPVEVVAEETNVITEKISKAVVKLTAANEAEEATPVSAIAYTGSDVKFVKDDLTSTFGMLTPQDEPAPEFILSADGTKVHMTFRPSNPTVYAGFYMGADIAIPSTWQEGNFVSANADGTYDFEIDASYCGKATPVAPVKKKDKTATTSTQYYLAIPSADKLEKEEAAPVSEIEYSGDVVKFCKEDGETEFGMFARQEGSAEEIKNGKVEITFVPKNTSVYAGFHYGLITDEDLTIDVELKDGKLVFSVPTSYCGKGVAVAPVKKKDGKTTGDQYFLCIPAKVPAAIPEDAIDYTGDVVKFCKEDGETEFGMFARQEGSAEEIKDSEVEITFVPKNTSVYAGFHYGPITDENLTIDVELKDGKFVFSVPAEYCGKGIPVAPVKKKDGKTTGEQYYLCIPSQAEPVTPDDPTPIDPTPVDPSQDDVVGTELAITNKATMFKVVNATLTTEKGQEYLVFVMNSSGYHELFKGTKTQAVTNGDGSKDKGNNTWIHGSVNSAGKWQFKLPLTKGESYVPITSISDRNYQSYLNGKGALADVFYGKQLKIDRTAKTLLVEDYNAADDKVTPDSEKPVPEEKTTPSDTNESSYAPAVDSSTTLPDGVYTPDSFSWSGGTGKLTISCTQITVKDGQAYATIVFSSDKVDQLKANGSIYYKEGSGPSTFTIPVNLNANNTIVGRTTAMSQPHWVEYTIYIGLAENEEQAEKAKEAKKDAAEAKTKLMDKAPAIVGLEAKEDQPEIEYSKNFKIFEYENDVKMISIDISEKTALDEEYTENAKKAAAASESKEQVQYDENGKAISKSKEEYTAELYKNKVVNYLLVPEDFEIPAGLDKEYIIVTVPSDKTFMASDEVISMMEELDCLDAITLLAMDEKDVKNDTLKKAIKDEKIKLAGNLEKPDYAKVVKDESTLAVLPGSVLPEEIDKNAKDKDKEKLEKEAKEKQEALEKIESRFAALAVPVVIDRSAQEEEELAQAEWVKVYGAFFGCEEEAEKIFEKKVKEAEKNGKN